MRALYALFASFYMEALKRKRKEGLKRDLQAIAKALAGHPAAKDFLDKANAL
jgi:hypothetical protein